MRHRSFSVQITLQMVSASVNEPRYDLMARADNQISDEG